MVDNISNEEVLDRYKIKKKLGKGGFGSVFLARDKETREKVAIKQIKNKSSFDRELEALNSVKNHCLKFFICILDYIENQNEYFIVLEYIPNYIVLSSVIKQDLINKRNGLNIINNLCMSILELQKLGYAHNDLKPDNILVDIENSNVKLIDFGLAIKEGYVTKKGTHISGTREYKDINLYLKVKEKDVPYEIRKMADYWAFGIIVYEIVMKETPYSLYYDIDDNDEKLSKSELKRRKNIIMENYSQNYEPKNDNNCKKVNKFLRKIGANFEINDVLNFFPKKRVMPCLVNSSSSDF